MSHHDQLPLVQFVWGDTEPRNAGHNRLKILNTIAEKLDDRDLGLKILEGVAELTEVSVDDLVGASREQPLAAYRQTAMFMVRSNTELSLPAIGNMFGERDHSTIIHGIKKTRLRLLGLTTPLVISEYSNLVSRVDSYLVGKDMVPTGVVALDASGIAQFDLATLPAGLPQSEFDPAKITIDLDSRQSSHGLYDYYADMAVV